MGSKKGNYFIIFSINTSVYIYMTKNITLNLYIKFLIHQHLGNN